MTNLEKELNFKAIGRTLLIELNRTETKNGIILPQQSEAVNIIDTDEAFRVMSISDDGIKSSGVLAGDYVYLTPHCSPKYKFTHNNKRYATMEIHEIAGLAPNGFDMEAWTKKKENERKVMKDRSTPGNVNIV